MIVSVLASLQYNGQQSIEPAVRGWTEWFWTQVTRVGSHVEMCHVFKNRAQFVLKCELGTNKNHFVNLTGATFVNHLHRQHLLIVNQVHLILTASNSQRK